MSTTSIKPNDSGVSLYISSAFYSLYYVMTSLASRLKAIREPNMRVSSFDFDGSLFNRNLIFDDDKCVIKHNKEFLDGLKTRDQSEKHIKKHTVFVGSNRQSATTDVGNSPKKGSCFPAIHKVVDFLNQASDTSVTLDKILLADIYAKREAGESFDRALHIPHDKQQPNWFFDSTKVSILYAQMHKVASENPNEVISFDFYDDRQDILDALHKFYYKNSHLFPANVKLNLHHYDGGEVQLKYSIQGFGPIDYGYRNTVRWMGRCASNKAAQEDAKLPDFLRNFRENGVNPYVQGDVGTAVDVAKLRVIQQTDPKSVQPLYDLSVLPSTLRDKLESIRNKSEDLRSRGFENEARIVQVLYNDLIRISCVYYQGIQAAKYQQLDDSQDDHAAYLKACQDRIETINATCVSSPRGYGDWKSAFAFTVVTLGAYAPVAVVSKLLTGKFNPFVCTDTETKIQQAAEGIREAVTCKV